MIVGGEKARLHEEFFENDRPRRVKEVSMRESFVT